MSPYKQPPRPHSELVKSTHVRCVEACAIRAKHEIKLIRGLDKYSNRLLTTGDHALSLCPPSPLFSLTPAFQSILAFSAALSSFSFLPQASKMVGYDKLIRGLG